MTKSLATTVFLLFSFFFGIAGAAPFAKKNTGERDGNTVLVREEYMYHGGQKVAEYRDKVFPRKRKLVLSYKEETGYAPYIIVENILLRDDETIDAGKIRVSLLNNDGVWITGEEGESIVGHIYTNEEIQVLVIYAEIASHPWPRNNRMIFIPFSLLQIQDAE